jgi:hypothetical protein
MYFIPLIFPFVLGFSMTKHLCIGILEKISWNSCIVLTDSSLNHIKFWEDSLPEVNGNQFTSDLSDQSIVYIDASNTIIVLVLYIASYSVILSLLNKQVGQTNRLIQYSW